jgi:hypothetical protein
MISSTVHATDLCITAPKSLAATKKCMGSEEKL